MHIYIQLYIQWKVYGPNEHIERRRLRRQQQQLQQEQQQQQQRLRIWNKTSNFLGWREEAKKNKIYIHMYTYSS